MLSTRNSKNTVCHHNLVYLPCNLVQAVHVIVHMWTVWRNWYVRPNQKGSSECEFLVLLCMYIFQEQNLLLWKCDCMLYSSLHSSSIVLKKRGCSSVRMSWTREEGKQLCVPGNSITLSSPDHSFISIRISEISNRYTYYTFMSTHTHTHIRTHSVVVKYFSRGK